MGKSCGTCVKDEDDSMIDRKSKKSINLRIVSNISKQSNNDYMGEDGNTNSQPEVPDGSNKNDRDSRSRSRSTYPDVPSE